MAPEGIGYKPTTKKPKKKSKLRRKKKVKK